MLPRTGNVGKRAISYPNVPFKLILEDGGIEDAEHFSLFHMQRKYPEFGSVMSSEFPVFH
jgi:hypothetical protein